MHQGFTARRIIRFPNRTDGGPVGAGIPGPSADGGFQVSLSDLAGAAATQYLGEQASVKVPIPNTGMRVRSVGIDPESAISCADIAWSGRDGEMERRRISPGNPAFLGCGTEPIDFLTVSIPWSLPLLPTSEFDDTGAEDIAAHDYGNLSPGVAAEYEINPGWPLRLELFYGDVPPMRTHRRAPYCAHFVGLMEGIDSTETREFLICVDGRRRVDVYAFVNGSGDITVEAFDHVGWKVIGTGLDDQGSDDVDAVILPLDDLGTTVATVNGTTPQCFSFDGNPMGILRIRCTGVFDEVGGSREVQIKIRAED